MKREFYPYLEGYRGLAVFLVLLSHWLIIEYFPSLIFLKLGFLGVNFFFVLSGFLITEILLIEFNNNVDRKTILKNFFSKRTLRIFPIYYITILFLAFFNLGDSLEVLPWTLTYSLNIAKNWWSIKDTPIFMHIWSLCVEEQFYLLLPFLVISFKKKFFSKIFLGLIFSSIVFKTIIYIVGFEDFESINHSNLMAAVDSLCLGSLLAYLKRYKKVWWNRIGTLPNFFMIIFLLFFFYISYYSEEYKLFSTSIMRLLASLLGGVIIAKAVNKQVYPLNSFFQFSSIRFLGKISYGVYLYHWVISYLLSPYFNDIWNSLDFNFLGKLSIIRYNRYLVSFIMFFAMTISLATISYYFIEKPLLKLKRFF